MGRTRRLGQGVRSRYYGSRPCCAFHAAGRYWLPKAPPRALPSRPGDFHPEPLTEPDLTLSRHPARADAQRLPPYIEHRYLPLPVDPSQMANAPLPSLHGHPASSLLRSSPPLAGASVLSASRFEPLAPFPLASRLGS